MLRGFHHVLHKRAVLILRDRVLGEIVKPIIDMFREERDHVRAGLEREFRVEVSSH